LVSLFSRATAYRSCLFYDTTPTQTYTSFPTRRSSDLPDARLGSRRPPGLPARQARRQRPMLQQSLYGTTFLLLLRPFHWTCCTRSEEHTSELQSRENLVCRLLLEKKKTQHKTFS